MNHIWEARDKGWVCLACGKGAEYVFEEIPAGATITKVNPPDNFHNTPYIEFTEKGTGDFVNYRYPSNCPPYEECQHSEMIECLLALTSFFPRGIWDARGWKEFSQKVPELLGVLLNVDAILPDGLNARAKKISTILEANNSI